MSRRLLGAFVPTERMVAVREIYVRLVEDGGPLEGCSFTAGQVSL